MTITNLTQAQAAAGLLFADGNRWAGSTITFSVPGVGATWGGYAEYGYREPSQSTYSTFSQAQGNAFRAVMATWDSYIASSIREVADTTPGDLRIAFTDVSAGGAAGYAYIPAQPGERAFPSYGDIWIDDGYKGSAFGRGGFDYEMLLHEAGHALGLKHSFEDTPLPAAYENTTYTVMSYTRTEFRYTFHGTDNGGVGADVAYVYDVTAMVADILAIQKLYGADTATGAGNTVYAITDATAEHRQSIYDVGGVDTLDLTALSRGSTVDLRQGAYSSLDAYSVDQQVADAVAQHGSWAESYFRQVLTDPNQKAYTFSNNFGIAFSTVIENVRGSAKADDITGNEAANLLDGRGGADSLRGLTGNDTYLVDNAADRVFEAANAGTDTVKASVSYVLAAGQSIEVLATAAPTSTAALNLTGNAFAQTLQGNAGANFINGGAGADQLYGLAGNDTYIVDDAGDRVFEATNAGTDSVRAYTSYALTAGQSIEKLSAAAGTGAINITGNELAQTLVGNAGANTLDGGAGADALYGQGGKDSFVFKTAPVTVDRIGDFSAVDDTVVLSRSIFTALSVGQLSEAAFKNVAVAGIDASDRILYDARSGALSYDADGSGSAKAVTFAILATKPADLSALDFLIA